MIFMKNQKILIVEDEGLTALNIKVLLETWGYTGSVVALSASEALDESIKFNFDLVLMDINLNGNMDGIEIADRLKNDFGIPVIYLTAHSKEKILERAKLTEPFGYIIKPFKNEELKITIETALYRHEMEKKLRKSEEALRKAHDNLELKVQRRTKELKESNEELKKEIEERKRAQKEINKNLKRLNILNKVILTVNRYNNLELLLNDLLSIITEMMDFDAGFIYLIGNGIAEIKCSLGLPPEFINIIDKIKIDEYPFNEILIKGRSIFSNEYKKHPPELAGRFKSRVSVPIYSNENIIGSLNLTSKRKHDFDDTEKQLITSIGQEIGNKITELNIEENMIELIDELKRSNNELRQFAHITSHDIQEPLRTITSFTQLLERRYKHKLDSDADEFIEYIVEASVRMKQMILDLLEYSEITKTEGKFTLLDSNKIVEVALYSLKKIIKESNARITYDYLPELTTDKNQLTIIFLKLIENAIKFKRENKPINVHISAYKDDNDYVFSVQDNGIGIEEQYNDRIFEVFKRLHAIDEYEGTGIGLPIVKRILERLGGEIWVESEYGKGSTFCFTIPIKQTSKKNLSKINLTSEYNREFKIFQP